MAVEVAGFIEKSNLGTEAVLTTEDSNFQITPPTYLSFHISQHTHPTLSDCVSCLTYATGLCAMSTWLSRALSIRVCVRIQHVS